MPYLHVPFDSLKLGRETLHIFGDLNNYDDIFVYGAKNEKDFMNIYLKEGRIVGASTYTKRRELILLKEAMRFNSLMREIEAGDEINFEKIEQMLLLKENKLRSIKDKYLMQEQDMFFKPKTI